MENFFRRGQRQCAARRRARARENYTAFREGKMRKVTEGYDGNILMKKIYILLKYIYIYANHACVLCVLY